MNLTTLDTGMAITFIVMGLISVVAMAVMSMQMKNYETASIQNCYISQLAIAVFFVMMLIPAVGFAYKGLSYTAGATMVMAGITAFGLTRLSNRAQQLLSQRYA